MKGDVGDLRAYADVLPQDNTSHTTATPVSVHFRLNARLNACDIHRHHPPSLFCMDLDSTSDDNSPSGGHAPQACASCRTRKRKCGKELPKCSLCRRIGRECDYSFVDSQSGPPSADDFAALRQKVLDLERLLSNQHIGSGSGSNLNNGSLNYGDSISTDSSTVTNGSLRSALYTSAGTWPGTSSFPTLFFLDSDLFDHERFQIQAPYVKVPPGVLSCLGNSTELRSMIETYFTTVHSYLPIVSKIRLYQHLSNPLHEPGADIALLFLAMKLTASQPATDVPPQSQLYQVLKSFLSQVEAQNGFSIQLIQAYLLISLYELGHGIYPACYLSIGHAGRLGFAMGLHDRGAPQMLARPSTWTEQEERRRVWWAIIILDRFVSIGNRRKPFATSDPSLDAHLPADDEHWDRGQMLVAAPLALSASQAIHAGPFARTCQAAHLLGKVIRHINDRNLPMDYRFDEALQLHRTTRALAEVLSSEAEEQEDSSLSCALAICYSGLLTLYDAYSCTQRAIDNGPETQLIMQKESIDGIAVVSEQAVQLARRIRTLAEQDGIARVSPLVIDSIYQAAANCAWYHRESSSPQSLANLTELKEILILLNQRWRVAGEYIKITEATEFHLASAIR